MPENNRSSGVWDSKECALLLNQPWVINTGLSNMIISADYIAGSTRLGGIVIRATNSTNYLLAYVEGASLVFYRVQNGTFIPRASAYAGITPGETYRLEVRAGGDRLELSVNGLLLFGIYESFQRTATRHGVSWNDADTSARFDNFAIQQWSGPPLLSGPANQIHEVGDVASSQIDAIDPEGSAMTYSASGLPPGLSLNAATGAISGVLNTVGIYNVAVGASDGNLASSKQFTWQVLQPPCSYSITPNSVSVAAVGSTQTVSVTTDPSCQWSAVTESTFVSVISGASGPGNGVVTYTVGNNYSGQGDSNPSPERFANIRIADRVVEIRQLGHSPAGGGGSSGPKCVDTLSPNSVSANHAGMMATVSVNAPASCGWTASSKASWIHVVSTDSGAGNGSVQYTVEPSTTFERTGTIYVSGRFLTVHQTAHPDWSHLSQASGCTMTRDSSVSIVRQFSFVPSPLWAPTMQDRIRDAAQAWNSVILEAGGSTVAALSESEGDLEIIIDPDTPGWAAVTAGRTRMYINPDLFGYPGSPLFDFSTALHEFGHVLGYADLHNCPNNGSIMSVPVNPQSYPHGFTNRDHKEIRNQFYGGWCGLEEFCSPLIFDFDAIGLALAGPSVRFDIAGTGAKPLLGWTQPGAEDAFLFLDRDGDKIVTDGRELFGTATPLSDTMVGNRAANGYLALAVFDSDEYRGNGDGMIDARDEVFARLRLWFDRNQNGRSEETELATLADRHVISIGLNYSSPGWRDEFGNAFVYQSFFTVVESNRVQVRHNFDVFFTTRHPTTLATADDPRSKRTARRQP